RSYSCAMRPPPAAAPPNPTTPPCSRGPRPTAPEPTASTMPPLFAARSRPSSKAFSSSPSAPPNPTAIRTSAPTASPATPPSNPTHLRHRTHNHRSPRLIQLPQPCEQPPRKRLSIAPWPPAVDKRCARSIPPIGQHHPKLHDGLR